MQLLDVILVVVGDVEARKDNRCYNELYFTLPIILPQAPRISTNMRRRETKWKFLCRTLSLLITSMAPLSRKLLFRPVSRLDILFILPRLPTPRVILRLKPTQPQRGYPQPRARTSGVIAPMLVGTLLLHKPFSSRTDKASSSLTRQQFHIVTSTTNDLCN